MNPTKTINNMNFYNADNLELMRGFADKEFDLAIVDPPYGIGINNNIGRRKGDKPSQYKKISWDNHVPKYEYFKELFRISKNQIIWGANYFSMPPTKCFIVWRKPQISEDVSFSMLEYAWASFNSTSKEWIGISNEPDRIHPTQKPIALYDWILKKYATEGDKILDTHLGSASIAIAIEKANRLDKMNLSFVGIEIDKEYFDKSMQMVEQYCRQGTFEF